jgi:hypothetical protein
VARKNGEGSRPRKRADGRWEARFWVDGKRRSVYSVGRREDVFLDRAEQEDEQGLRAANRHERGVHLRGHDPGDGEAFGSCSVVFGQFLQALR